MLHDGADILNVAHFGRHLGAGLRSALELGKPPGFEGMECSEPGCERRYGLQWDHVDPVANAGPTSYGNLQALCKPHHWDKTERDRQHGLLGPRRHKAGRAPARASSAPAGGQWRGRPRCARTDEAS